MILSVKCQKTEKNVRQKRESSHCKSRKQTSWLFFSLINESTRMKSLLWAWISSRFLLYRVEMAASLHWPGLCLEAADPLTAVKGWSAWAVMEQIYREDALSGRLPAPRPLKPTTACSETQTHTRTVVLLSEKSTEGHKPTFGLHHRAERCVQGQTNLWQPDPSAPLSSGQSRDSARPH